MSDWDISIAKPGQATSLSSKVIRGVFAEINTLLNKFPDITGNNDAILVVDTATGAFLALSKADFRAHINVTDGAEANPELLPLAEGQAGMATTERVISAERLRQIIDALAPGGSGDVTQLARTVARLYAYDNLG